MCRKRSQRDLDRLLSIFLNVNDATQDQIELYEIEAVRLELFDRLGMTHTCCDAFEANHSSRPVQERKCEEFLNFLVNLFIQYRLQERSVGKEMRQRWWTFLSPFIEEMPLRLRCLSFNPRPRYTRKDEGDDDDEGEEEEEEDDEYDEHDEDQEDEASDNDDMEEENGDEGGVWESGDEDCSDSAWETEEDDSEDERIATVKRGIQKGLVALGYDIM
ncbi:hypothetical protein QQX98_006574 [Neonectria punicea]|uniref:Uncharacterized protein n=1 Tax=Neonectria punicea TaxID=979145 RepID=A0ABR1H0N6_9HYPO